MSLQERVKSDNSKIKQIRTPVMARDIERHSFFVDGLQVKLSKNDPFLIKHRLNEVAPVRPDDRSPASKHQVVGLVRQLRCDLKLIWQVTNLHQETCPQHETSPFTPLIPPTDFAPLRHYLPPHAAHIS